MQIAVYIGVQRLVQQLLIVLAILGVPFNKLLY